MYLPIAAVVVRRMSSWSAGSRDRDVSCHVVIVVEIVDSVNCSGRLTMTTIA